jgi:acylpyruvate hydrolase
MAVRIENEYAVQLGISDVGALLQEEDWLSLGSNVQGDTLAIGTLDYAPLIPNPGKIICVGLNYRDHADESGKELPRYPALFTKYPSTLIGANDDICIPPETDMADWEVELAFVIGRRGRRIPIEQARSHIAGFAILNDISFRDWQRRTSQWFAGKAFEETTPFGPWLVTDDGDRDRELVCDVNGQQMQCASTNELVHNADALVAYLSTILTLEPGDVVATGTPAGVGAAQTPPRFLKAGDIVTTTISGLGECRNVCR